MALRNEKIGNHESVNGFGAARVRVSALSSLRAALAATLSLAVMPVSVIATPMTAQAEEAGDRVAALIEKLESAESLKVRITACMLLGNLADERAVDPLVKLSNDPAFALRGAAVVALGRVGSPKAIPALFARLSDSDGFVKAQAARALAQVAEKPAAIGAILSYYRAAAPDQKAKAVEVLANVHNPMALSEVVLALADDDANLAKAAGDALLKHADEELVPILTTALYTREANVRARVIDLMKARPHKDYLPPLATIVVNDLPGPERDAARSALDAMKDQIDSSYFVSRVTISSDEKEKARAIALLTVKADEPAIVGLISIVENNSDGLLAGRAAQGLAQLGDGRATASIRTRAGKESNARAKAMLQSALSRLEASRRK